MSRGELVEIGGSFRMPDVMALERRAAARGRHDEPHPSPTTIAAPSVAQTGLLLKVHTSNYRIVGFTAVGRRSRSWSRSAARPGVPVLEDLGSGALVDLAVHGLPREPVVRERIAAGADLVTFSGDKLLGGPQAGLIVGRARSDRPPGAASAAPRAAPGQAHARGAGGDAAALPRRAGSARRCCRRCAGSRVRSPSMEAIGRATAAALAGRSAPGHLVDASSASEAEVGSGALPATPLASRALAIAHPDRSPDEIAARFRAARPPVLGRIHDGRFLLDLRGIFAPADLLVDLATPAPCP